MVTDLTSASEPSTDPVARTGPRGAVRYWSDRPERQRAGVLHGISLVIAFPLLLWIDRHQWFSGDEWDFLLRRGVLGHHDLGLLDPHNEHWVTFPVLVYRALFSVFGVRTYLPYLVVLVVAHLIVAHLLWRLMLRCGVDWRVATGAAAVFMVLGAGWEDLVNAFQITFVAPIALGLVALLLVPERGPFQRRDVWVSAVLVLSLPFSGVSLTMALVVGVVIFLRRGWKPAVLTLIAPGVVYLVWYLGWGRFADAIQQEPLRVALQKAPEFVWHGLVAAVDTVTGLVGSGPVLLVLLTIWLVWKRSPTREPWPLVLATFVGAPLFLFLIDIRRSGLGIDAAGAPRYSYAVLALLLPAAALAATVLVARTPLRTVLVVATTAVLCLVGFTDLNDAARIRAPFSQENKHRILAAADLVRSNATFLADQPVPEFDPDLTIARLRSLSDRDQLPGNVAVSEQDRLTAATFLQVAVGDVAPASASGQATIEFAEGGKVSPGRAGCVVVTPGSDRPAVVLSFDHPGTVRLTTSRTGALTAQLQPPNRDPAVLGLARTWGAEGGVPQQVSSSATKLWLRVGVPADGTTRLCGLAEG